MEDEGAKRSGERPLKLLAKSIAAGVCVGLGGILCSGVGGDLGTGGHFWDRGAGHDRFIFGAIGDPLSITLVVVTASSVFTGNLALAGAALHANKCSAADALYMLLVTYGGCFVGTVWCGMLSAVCALPGAAASAAIAAHKLELTLLQTFARGIGGGLLISLAILLATTAVRNHGNIADIFVSAFLPISAYVASDFEHVLANFFFFAAQRAHTN
jgi:formate/nitrite transporter FocA (FNT family)